MTLTAFELCAGAGGQALGIKLAGFKHKSLADVAPDKNFTGVPRLTIPMVARLQGFPDDWQFVGKKTAAYRQVGNAFPPAVAHAVARQIMKVLSPVHQPGVVLPTVLRTDTGRIA